MKRSQTKMDHNQPFTLGPLPVPEWHFSHAGDWEELFEVHFSGGTMEKRLAF